MSDIGVLIAWLIAVVAVGWGMISVIFRKSAELFTAEKFALSYAVGLGLISVAMAALSAAGVRIEVYHIALMAIAGWTLSLYFKGSVIAGDPRRYPLSFIEKFFILAIVFQIGYAFFRAMIMPIEAYDAVAIYGIKAKIFYLAGGVPQDFFSRMGSFVNHIEYPLLIPLAEDSIYIFFKGINDIASKAIFPMYYLSALIVLYSMIRRFAARKAALLFTFLLATVPQFYDYASNGYADLPLAFYFSAGLFYMFLWMRGKPGSYLALSLLLSAMAVWTKSEGLALLGVNIFTAIFYAVVSGKVRARQAVLYIAICVISAGLYLKLMHSLGIGINADFTGARPDIITALKRLPSILYEYQIHVFGPKKWNIIWILFILAFFTGLRKAFSGILKLPTLTILFVLAGYTAVYMVTPQNFSWHLSTTASRLFLHFLPVVVLWLALYYKEDKLDI